VELGAGEILLLAGAGLIAGAVNAVAGGGSLISFPALLAVGYPALDANVTNIVALVPGYVGGVVAYREELGGQRERGRRLSAVSVLGGAAGAVLLLLSPPGVFEALVPFLVLAGCALLAVQPLVPQAAGGRDRRGTLAATFFAAVYGGYFGAALGVMLLAILGLMTSEDLQRANALKALLSLVIAVVSAALLGVFGPIAWAAAAIMAVTSLAGGRLGGALARKLRADALRWAVVALGTVLAITFFV
jgi:uncharacterized membrane protein YfcA